MLVPMEWLKDYIDIEASIDLFSEKMIMSGSNIETCQTLCEGMDKVVLGKIEKITKHQDADKLLVCQVNIGEKENRQVVTGASNVFEGALVPVAVHGSRIPGALHGKQKEEGGTKITKGKIRGVESYGMFCSASELGFDDKVVPVVHKDGIWILEEDMKPGTDFAEAMGLGDVVIDFEITTNRPDCLSMIGMAREVAATLGGKLHYPESTCKQESKAGVKDYIQLEIQDPKLCKRFTARIVTDVKIGQSPWWIQKRLMYAGMRPINNIVDLSNFVMLEYGQPIHAYDIRQIQGGKLIVARATEGETFVTLDNTERTLSGDMLMIRDGKQNVGIAGIMGGLDSEIQADTTTILIEAANFEKDSIRQTSKKLGLRTEASSRFEKGLDPNLCATAADRMCRLIELLECGRVVSGIEDVYPKKETAPVIDVRVSRINQVLGTDLSAKEIADILSGLEMGVENQGKVLRVTPPTVRRDLLIEEDFAEEIARLYGYDRLPTTLPKGSEEAAKSKERMLTDLARDTMCAMGLNEIQTYSFVSPKGADDAGMEKEKQAYVYIKNPLGEENSVLRTTLTPNMLETLGRNYSRNIQEVKAFEIGNIFLPGKKESLPNERPALSVGLYGQGINFFTLKGMLSELLKVLGIRGASFVAGQSSGVYHPGRQASISVDGTELGMLGEVHPDVAQRFGLDLRVYCCELFFDRIISLADTQIYYQPLPKYPATSRDIALLVAEHIQAGDIEKIIKEEGTHLLEEVRLFDIYRGQQVEEGKKSVAFTLTYRHREKTLTDEETNRVHEKVLTALKEKINAVLREV